MILCNNTRHELVMSVSVYGYILTYFLSVVRIRIGWYYVARRSNSTIKNNKISHSRKMVYYSTYAYSKVARLVLQNIVRYHTLYSYLKRMIWISIEHETIPWPGLNSISSQWHFLALYFIKLLLTMKTRSRCLVTGKACWIYESSQEWWMVRVRSLRRFSQSKQAGWAL